MKRIILSNETRKANSLVGHAQILTSESERAENYVKAAREANFLVHCTEAIAFIGFSAKTSPEFWNIEVYSQGKLKDDGFAAAVEKLREAWKPYRRH